ncbi:MAG: hypothetical protein Q7T20_17700 [Saprospiraceae bacterium]|nr:hypothetical protein [Saprospiraceae bacterium]
MQRISTVFVLSLFAINVNFAALPAGISKDLFQDDLSKWDCELAPLSALEQLIQASDITQTQLLQAEHSLTQYLLPEGDLSGSLFGGTEPGSELLVGIPGFLWGFCCSAFGILLVYLAVDDPASKKKQGTQAMIGCAIGTALWVGLYVWFVVSLSFQ